MLLPLALALALAPPPGSVELGPDAWRTLHPATPPELATPAWAATRTVTLTPAPGGVLVRATWTIRSLSRGTWFSGQVLGDIPGMRVEQVTWDGRPVATRAGPGGVTIAERTTGASVLELVAFLPGEPTRDPLTLLLLPAVRGHVTVVAPEGLVATLRTPVPTTTIDPSALEHPHDILPIGPHHWTGAARLDLGFAAAPSPAARTVVVARAGVGLTVGDAELRGRARLVWEVRQGTLDAVEFTATNTGADLEISGPGVRAVQRDGDSVRALLQAPVTGRLELTATWTAALARSAESRAALPRFNFSDVFRSETSLQLARDGEVEAVPDLTGWTPTTAAALPAWGQGLVEGAPTAAYRGTSTATGALDLLRFVPLAGPPVVIDVAAYTIATSREGRALIRAHYEVRNERAATLRVRPPPGFELLGVRVGGTTSTPARDQDGAWRIPLQRSVETVAGTLSFPVEIAFLGGSAPWDRRERRALALPILDAPIAVVRTTLHLPPGYRSRLTPGDGDVVAAFTRGDGITYGLGVGDVGAAEADALFQSAVRHWLANEFDAAQADLDKLKSFGARNENITRLQGNLDVIQGSSASDEKGAQRRIREQARARSIADQQLQDDLRNKAAESRNAGDYDAAESQYKAAIAVGDRLAKLEQRESVEQQSRNQDLAQQLESTRGEFAARKRRSKSAKQRPPSSSFSAGGESPTTRTTRDHTAIVDVATTSKKPDAPAPPPDPGAFDLDGLHAANNTPDPASPVGAIEVPPPAPVRAVSRISASRGATSVRYNRKSGRIRTRETLDTKFKEERQQPEKDTLPAPQVTASNVSVVVPQLGRPVLYQRLLLPADAPHTLDISAREPLLAKD